jgi:hypothetical protein
LLDIIKSSLNHAVQDELEGGYTLGYDTSEIAALRANEGDKAKIAKTYYEIGVPVSVVNDKLALGLQQYEGWDTVSRVVMPNEAGAAQMQSVKESESKEAVVDSVRSIFVDMKSRLKSGGSYEELIKESSLRLNELAYVLSDSMAFEEWRFHKHFCRVIAEQVEYSKKVKFSPDQTRQAIIDTGVFNDTNIEYLSKNLFINR